ncbi:hypothetical protein BKA65DRAFT_520874 [Rhexocercosporidium sp. MPI-PUGE-AT-0058]|nr:hypothetical protein BKA65DRAFT_520874 [Rhexocercosporidium sp. MPI-PUGE-AT-0058]
MLSQPSAFIMAGFSTFQSNTTAIPTEITTQILGYIVADARSLGGSVRTHTKHHPVAIVSKTFRAIYLNSPYSTSTKGRETTPAKLRIGDALEFSDLKTLSAFFEHGPGRDAITLHNVRFLSVSYLDDENATGWGQRTTDYAYEAFEYLYKHWAIPWRPLGLENVGGSTWRGQMTWQEQYNLLDSRYKYLHDRETVTERCKRQRNAYHKRRRRWPMLSKRRKRAASGQEI